MPISTDQKLYWHGNAAKTRVIGEILRSMEDGRETVVFDYGCGEGGDWPNVLKDFPQIRLYGYEPHPASFQKAKARLKDTGAVLLRGEEIRDFTLAADHIVSFSVLEHVYDRSAYLFKAKTLLAPGGRFHLNYDDGHFRNVLDLGNPSNWREVFREWRLNRSAGLRAWLGRISSYQRRVMAADLEPLVHDVGLQILDSRFDNLLALKTLARSIPADLKDEYVRFWLGIEERLNSEFRFQGKPVMGDPANLWTQMVSKTLVLGHRSAA